MQDGDIVIAYFAAAEHGDWATFAELLDDNFIFTAVPIIQNKMELVSATRSLWNAFPDLKFNFRVISVANHVVTGTYKITGTHTGTLIPPLLDRFVIFQPTGKHISLPEAGIEVTIQGRKIIRQKNESKAESSWPGILDQLGLENPYL